MGKRATRWAAICLISITMALLLFPAPLYADEVGPVSASLASDADSYEAGSEASLQITVVNEGDTAVDASWQLSLPEGVSLLDGQSDAGSMESLDPGEQAQATVRVKMPEAQGSEAAAQSAPDPSSGMPAAGDIPPAAIAALAAAAAAAAAAAILGRRRLRGPLCVLLAVASVSLVGFGAAGAAYADQSSDPAASAQRTVSVDGNSLTFRLSVTCAAASGGQPEDPDDPTPPGGDGVEVSVEYKDGVLAFDDYELADGGYIVSAEAVEQAVADMEARRAEDAAQGGASSYPVLMAAARAGDSIREGAVCAFEGTDANPSGAAGVVTEVEYRTNELHKPEFLVKLQQAHDPNDVLASFSASARSQAIDLGEAEFAEGVVAEGDPSDLLKLNLKVDKELPSGDELKLSLWLKPVLDADIDWNSGSFERCSLRLGLEGQAKGSADVKGVEETIPLLKKPMVQQLGHGLNVAFNVNLKLSCDGSVSIGVDLEGIWRMDYQDNKFKDASTSDASFVDPSIEGEAKLGAQPYIMLRLLGIEIVDAGLEIGGAASGSVTPRPTGMICTDRAIYLYAEFSVGENTGWLKKAGISGGPWVIWDEDSSPLPMHEHLEDGHPVDSCTYEPEPLDPTPADDFEWRDYGGGIAIEGYLGDDTSVMIPAEINGKPVTDVDFGAVSYREGPINRVESISLEEGSRLRYFYVTEAGLDTGYDDPEENPYTSEWLALSSVDLTASDEIEWVVTGYRAIDLKVDGESVKYLGSRMDVSEIDLSDYPNLVYADFYKSPIKSIATQGASSGLLYLGVRGTDISSIDLSPIPQLESLYCSGTNLKSLDVSPCKGMSVLDCSDCGLADLVIGEKGDNQFNLYCSDNELTELDLGGVPRETIYDLHCNGNRLTSLDLEGCYNLGGLFCQDNQLKTLNVRDCSYLSSLCCADNLLTELDLTGCVDLHILDCMNNKLTELDISPCTRYLAMVSVHGNPIKDTSALEEWGSQGDHKLYL